MLRWRSTCALHSRPREQLPSSCAARAMQPRRPGARAARALRRPCAPTRSWPRACSSATCCYCTQLHMPVSQPPRPQRVRVLRSAVGLAVPALAPIAPRGRAPAPAEGGVASNALAASLSARAAAACGPSSPPRLPPRASVCAPHTHGHIVTVASRKYHHYRRQYSNQLKCSNNEINCTFLVVPYYLLVIGHGPSVLTGRATQPLRGGGPWAWALQASHSVAIPSRARVIQYVIKVLSEVVSVLCYRCVARAGLLQDEMRFLQRSQLSAPVEARACFD
jgi:hypothetical protein